MNKISDILCNKVNKNITQIILDYCFTEDKKKYLQELRNKIHLLKADLQDEFDFVILSKIQKIYISGVYFWNFSYIWKN